MAQTIYAFSKRVTSDKIKPMKIIDDLDIKKIKSIINKLPQPKEKDLKKINLRTNPRNWIKSLLENFPNINESEMNQLLYDFTDSMRYRMREATKYIIGILLQDQLLLSHSIFGEETITPEWKTIPRMLDSDNILRYAQFIQEQQSIKVRYYEKYATESFVEWLRLPLKDAFYHFGGYYRLYSEVEKKINVFELNEKQIEEWIKKHPEMKEGRIKFANPLEYLTIKQVYVGARKYENIRDFLQDFHAEKYDINYYHDRYNKIIGSLEPYSNKYLDEKNRLVKIVGDKQEIVLEKQNPNFDILFINDNIELRDSYLEDLYTRFVNKEEINLFHAGGVFMHPPLSFANLKIWNKVNQGELNRIIIDYYITINLQDRNLKRLIEILFFKIITENNKKMPISRFFRLFYRRLEQDIQFNKRFTKLENDELNVQLEFKARDFFTGKDKEIIDRISGYLDGKLGSGESIILLIGVEDDGTLDPIPINRLKSDRVSSLMKKVQNSIPSPIYFLSLTQESDGILLIYTGNTNVFSS
ncbi:MAG: hypothetical protein ACFFAU_20705 [Candidatus Hodarchaeota archaeon]